MRLLLLVLALCASTTASAQAYPTKPVRWIVPAGPGTSVDVSARRIAPLLASALGQPVTVENRAGDNSMRGARSAARAAPDGHTLFHGLITNALNDLLTPDPCCVLNERLVPVTRLGSMPLVLVVHPSVPATTVQEYVALARSKPNQLTYASGHIGTLKYLVGALFKESTGVQIRALPYGSFGAELPDLIEGHVSTAFLSPVVIRDPVNSGKLRALAVAGRMRVARMGEVPTMREAGYPQMEATVWDGLFVPAGTPAPVVERLWKELAAVLRSPEMQSFAASLGYRPGGEPPSEFGAFVRAEIAKWGGVIKEAGIRAP